MPQALKRKLDEVSRRIALAADMHEACRQCVTDALAEIQEGETPTRAKCDECLVRADYERQRQSGGRKLARAG